MKSISELLNSNTILSRLSSFFSDMCKPYSILMSSNLSWHINFCKFRSLTDDLFSVYSISYTSGENWWRCRDGFVSSISIISWSFWIRAPELGEDYSIWSYFSFNSDLSLLFSSLSFSISDSWPIFLLKSIVNCFSCFLWDQCASNTFWTSAERFLENIYDPIDGTSKNLRFSIYGSTKSLGILMKPEIDLFDGSASGSIQLGSSSALTSSLLIIFTNWNFTLLVDEATGLTKNIEL